MENLMKGKQFYPRTLDSETGDVITFAGQVVYPLRGEALQVASQVEPVASPPMHTADAPAPRVS
jgi:hypothetical protein